MDSNQDFAFSDEDSLPEGWPELNVDDIVTGEWLEGKSPSSVALRRHMAEMVRFWRKEGLAHAGREMHRRHRAELVAMEQSLAETHRKFVRDFKLWLTRPQGGVQ